MEADHQKKLFKALFETVGGWVGVQSPKLSLTLFKTSFFNLYMGGWLGGVTSMARALKMRFYCGWLPLCPVSKAHTYVQHDTSTEMDQGLSQLLIVGSYDPDRVSCLKM